MLKKILVASCLLVSSMASQATIISHFGYERDSASNIVTGGGLEWLMWDVTKGMSINGALAAYSDGDWTLATNSNMASLFNAFQFGKTNWSNVETSDQESYVPWSEDENSSHNMFMALFGFTFLDSTSFFAPTDYYVGTRAFYGVDDNNDGYYNNAVVIDDYTIVQGGAKVDHQAIMYRDSEFYNKNTGYTDSGVALVRVANVVPPTQVSLPGSLSLLALGLVALGYRRRQALCR